MLKLVLISPSGSIFINNQFQEIIISQLVEAIKDLSNDGIKFVVWSNQRYFLKENSEVSIADYLTQRSGVQVDYIHATQDGYPARQRAGSVTPILEKYNVRINETILVGSHKIDMLAGVNNKLLLLRPLWYENAITYGFELDSISKLHRFCKVFGTRKNTFFWEIEDSESGLSYHAIGPFSTIKPEYSYFGDDAFQAAKLDSGTKEFWSLLTISTLYFSGITQNIKMITVYPGHSSEQREKYFHASLDTLGKCFGIPFSNNLLVRHTTAIKSTNVRAENRKFSTQLRTIKFNPDYSKYNNPPTKTKKPIRDMSILVIDDICTSGKSLESARKHLQNEGASTILFSWLKTISSSYTAITRHFNLAEYLATPTDLEPGSTTYTYYNQITNAAAPAELENCLKNFQSWKV